eukprot:scaffold27624_cov52-Cyclotella_meneghiniana.AAC.2
MQQLALSVRDRRLKEAVTTIHTIATKISIMTTLIYATTMRKQHSARAHYAASSRRECTQQP